MKKIITSLSLLAFFGLGSMASAQITGVVTDTNGLPEFDAEIIVKGTDTTTYTDEEGKFTIDAKIGDIITINGVEVKVISKELNFQKSIDENIDLEETVITAYGSQKRETIVGSNLQIKADAFEDSQLLIWQKY